MTSRLKTGITQIENQAHILCLELKLCFPLQYVVKIKLEIELKPNRLGKEWINATSIDWNFILSMV